MRFYFTCNIQLLHWGKIYIAKQKHFSWDGCYLVRIKFLPCPQSYTTYNDNLNHYMRCFITYFKHYPGCCTKVLLMKMNPTENYPWRSDRILMKSDFQTTINCTVQNLYGKCRFIMILAVIRKTKKPCPCFDALWHDVNCLKGIKFETNRNSGVICQLYNPFHPEALIVFLNKGP